MTRPEGDSEFCFPRISVFPEMKSKKTLRFEGKGTSRKVICYIAKQMGQTEANFEKRAEIKPPSTTRSDHV